MKNKYTIKGMLQVLRIENGGKLTFNQKQFITAVVKEVKNLQKTCDNVTESHYAIVAEKYKYLLTKKAGE